MVNLKLVDYIKKNKKKGYSDEEILKILEENDWEKKEINEAYSFIKSYKKQEQVQKKQEIKTQKGQINPNSLSKFIQSSLSKGISEREIRLALSLKGWRQEIIDESFRNIKFIYSKSNNQKYKEVIKPTINIKKIFSYLFSFLFILSILTGTAGVFLYIDGIGNYVIFTEDGEELRGTCLEPECTDLKDYALGNVKINILTYFIASIILTLALLAGYIFLPFKHEIIWIYNILYFLILVYIIFKWVMFQNIS